MSWREPIAVSRYICSCRRPWTGSACASAHTDHRPGADCTGAGTNPQVPEYRSFEEVPAAVRLWNGQDRRGRAVRPGGPDHPMAELLTRRIGSATAGDRTP